MELKASIEKHVKGIAYSLCFFFYLLMFVLSFRRATVWYFESHAFDFVAIGERLLWPLSTAPWLLILVAVPGVGIVFLGLLVMTIVFAVKKKKIPFLIFLTLLGTFFCLFSWGIWTRVP